MSPNKRPPGRFALAFAVLTTRLESDHYSTSYSSLPGLQAVVSGTHKHYSESVRVICRQVSADFG